MTKRLWVLSLVIIFLFLTGCSTYRAQPLPFKTPAAYGNAVEVEGAIVGAQAYADPKEAQKAFGFDVRGAGMLPVQVVFDNQGSHPLEINAGQTFLEDAEGNLWPILSSSIAYERATKFAQTKNIFKEGAYGGFLGATAGTIIGAAVGIVSGENIGEAIGKGAAVGAAAGATIGGTSGYANADEARRAIINDLQEKSLQNKPITPQNLAFGFLFFPGEASSAKQLRLQIRAVDTGAVHVVNLKL